MTDEPYTCPECDGEFPEPVDTTAKTLHLGAGFVEYDAKGCPWCGHPMTTTKENPRETTLFGGSDD